MGVTPLKVKDLISSNNIRGSNDEYILEKALVLISNLSIIYQRQNRGS